MNKQRTDEIKNHAVKPEKVSVSPSKLVDIANYHYIQSTLPIKNLAIIIHKWEKYSFDVTNFNSLMTF